MGLAQVIMIVLALVTLGTGVVLNQKDTYPEVLSEADNFESETQTPQPTSMATPTPTSQPLPTPHNTPTPATTTDTNLSSLFYPGASVVSTDGNTARLTSSANPDTIFSWYLEQFKLKKLNAISSSKTSVNNNFQAKLAGADGSINIEVEITKPANQSTVVLALKLTQ